MNKAGQTSLACSRCLCADLLDVYCHDAALVDADKTKEPSMSCDIVRYRAVQTSSKTGLLSTLFGTTECVLQEAPKWCRAFYDLCTLAALWANVFRI